MARLALITVGVTSHLNACLALAEQLDEAGHEVLLASTRHALAERVTAQGVAFAPLGAGPGERDGRPVRATARQRRRARYEASLAGFGIDALIDDWRPDLLLVDSEFHAVILRALARGLSPLILEYHVAPRRRAGLPPLNSSRLPSGGLLDRVRCDLEWRALLWRRRARLVWAWLRAGGRDELSAWRRIAKGAGLGWRTSVRRDQWPLLTYPSLVHLYLSAPGLQFPGHGDDPAYVGPAVQSSRVETVHPSALAEVRHYLAERHGDRPLVACFVGSLLCAPAFLRRVRDAAQGAAFDVLIACGKDVAVDDLRPLPSNVLAVPYAPQLEVLRAADVLICHGGIATVHEAVLAEVPMLVCSGSFLDQNGNAARVAYHGLGLREDLHRSSPAQLRAAIERLLREECFAEALARMASHYRTCIEERRALRAIEVQLAAGAVAHAPAAATH